MVANTLNPIPTKAQTAILDLYSAGFDADEPGIYSAAIEAAVKLTGSEIGYFHLVNEDQETIELGTWSAGTLRQCTAVYDRHYQISNAGIWADTARHRRTFIHNDYQALTNKRGYPEGHTHLVRHLGVPVLYEDRVVLLVGVGNKSTEYDEEDLAYLQAIADHAWSLILLCRQKASWLDAERQFQDLQELADISTWVLDPEEQTLIFDSNFGHIFGTTRNRTACSIDELLHFVDERDHVAVLDVLYKPSLNSAFDIDVRGLHAGRTPISLYFHGRAFPRSQGHGIILRGFLQDVTKRWKIEAALRERESQYRVALETSADGFWMADMDGRLLEVNDAYVMLSGYTREELLTMRIQDLEAVERPKETIDRIGKIIRKGYDRFESTHRTKDGKLWPVEIVATYSPISDGRLFAFLHDITKRKKAEQQLLLEREQQTILRELLEITLEGWTLEKTLQQLLARLTEISWLSLLPKAGIFLLEKDGKNLRLFIQQGMSPEIQKRCEHLTVGTCHCGHAASTRQLQHADCVDARHEIKCSEMPDHGHYSVPLLAGEQLVGVLALYLTVGFQRDSDKEEFITSVGSIIAGCILRKSNGI